MDSMLESFQQGLQTGEIPRVLYKYRSVAAALEFLRTAQIKFSTCDEFNDPFECCAYVDGTNTEAEWRQFLLQQRPKMHPVQIQKMAHALALNPTKARAAILNAIDSQKKEDGFFCMTANKQNLLMWAHYADQHQGVCLAFDLSQDPNTFCFPKQVEYSDTYKTYNYLRTPHEAANTLFHKSQAWSYEEEYRILKMNFHGLRDVNKSALVEITFGCRCSEQNRTEIRQAAKDYPNVVFLEAVQNNRRYQLDIKKL